MTKNENYFWGHRLNESRYGQTDGIERFSTSQVVEAHVDRDVKCTTLFSAENQQLELSRALQNLPLSRLEKTEKRMASQLSFPEEQAAWAPSRIRNQSLLRRLVMRGVVRMSTRMNSKDPIKKCISTIEMCNYSFIMHSFLYKFVIQEPAAKCVFFHNVRKPVFSSHREKRRGQLDHDH